MTQRPLTHESPAGVGAPDRAMGGRTPGRTWSRRPPVSWAVAFVMFWYRFIIGDDWTLAAAVAVGLAVTAVLQGRGISIWWLVPAIVIVMVGVDLERASRRARRR